MEAGHDWNHTERVWKMSRFIAAKEGGNTLIIELAALLHDIADPKFHEGNEDLAFEISKNHLRKYGLSEEIIVEVLNIIGRMSFKNRREVPEKTSLEFKIVQDADRLDAIGAIGVARAFNFGGYKNNPMHHPLHLPRLQQTKEEYKNYNGTTINHFYEKLLLLKEMMNTSTAKKIASERHDFMLYFLNQFFKEWHGSDID